MAKRDTKSKGELGEISVIKDLMMSGWSVAIPFGENKLFDLIIFKEEKFLRVQVKYRASDNQGKLKVGLRTVSNGKALKVYTKDKIDYLAIYDPVPDRCFYLPVGLVEGKTELTLTYFPNSDKDRYIEEFVRIDD